MKILKGRVVSTKMAKTATVLVETSRVHPLYKKAIRRRRKFHAQNLLEAKEGNLVKMKEIRPVSKTIRWSIIEITKKENKK